MEKKQISPKNTPRSRLANGLKSKFKTKTEVLEVNFQNDMLEMDVRLDTDIPHSNLGFQVPSNTTVDFEQFSFAGEAKSPRVSIVTCPGYEHGLSTNDLLTGSATPFQAGTGISLSDITPVWIGTNAHGEFEWPVVIRRFADGAVTNDEGDTFEFRMVDADGNVHGNRTIIQYCGSPSRSAMLAEHLLKTQVGSAPGRLPTEIFTS